MQYYVGGDLDGNMIVNLVLETTEEIADFYARMSVGDADVIEVMDRRELGAFDPEVSNELYDAVAEALDNMSVAGLIG